MIDVNTGRFVGSRSKSTSQRLEDTIVKNNLEAVKEVVRQLRLRDIGGIIVIDFIDMANPKNRQAVEGALRTELERDRTKTYVVEISPLGLVEMTRQNVTDGPREVMTKRCPTCDGDGIVVSDATAALEVERRLRDLAAAGARVQAYRVAVHPRVLPLLAGPGGSRLAELEERTKRRFFLVPAEGHVHTDFLEVQEEGKLETLQPESPLTEGAELEVKLVELGLHDASTGVAKVDGVDLIVADAAKLVGKKALVTVGRVLESQAFATLVSDAPQTTAITFESEAEKPTRAPAKRRAVAGEATTEDEVVPAVTADVDEPLDDEALDDEPAVSVAAQEEPEVESDADGESGAAPAPRKRTRRGSRGGKRRKKPAGTGDGEAGAEVETEEPAATGAEDAETGEAVEAPMAKPKPKPKPRPRKPRQPRIHVPAADLGDPDAASSPADGDGVVPETPPESDGADTPAPDGDGNGAAPRKRTRRGSRGGRNRRKKPVAVEGAEESAAAPEDGVEEPEEVVEAVVATATAPVEPEAPTGDGYVPMSEWLEDFDRPR